MELTNSGDSVTKGPSSHNIGESAILRASIRFPDPVAEIRRHAREFQQLSVDERFQQIISIMALGKQLIQESPQREAIERRINEHNQKWRQIQSDLIDQHGRRISKP